MASLHEVGDLLLDPAIRNWVLAPITAVMLLTGLLKHFITQLMSKPPSIEKKQTRESQALMRGRLLRANGHVLTEASFAARKEFLTEKFNAGAYLRDGAQGGPNPQATMEASMEQMKRTLPNIIPHSLTMVWVQTLFKGFVMMKLPFPLTLRFKSMLQSGIDVFDLHPSWVSSFSWFILNVLGQRPIFTLILGEGNAADSMRDMQSLTMAGVPGAQPGQVQDMSKLFKDEADNIELTRHEWSLANVEERLLGKAVKRTSAPKAAAAVKARAAAGASASTPSRPAVSRK